jgi:hypothetical protein
VLLNKEGTDARRAASDRRDALSTSFPFSISTAAMMMPSTMARKMISTSAAAQFTPRRAGGWGGAAAMVRVALAWVRAGADRE